MKNLKNLGKTLNRAEQKLVSGGIPTASGNCINVCANATKSRICDAGHCVYFCDGKGGAIPL